MKICEPGGGGILLPLFGEDEQDFHISHAELSPTAACGLLPAMCLQEWRKGLRAVLYLLGLLWLFMAVATVSDIFMGKALGLLFCFTSWLCDDL